MRFPIKRPAFPRASSATSGFFFCGIIEEPVEYASATLAHPNSDVAQMHHSSPIRERWTPTIEIMKSASATKSRSETPSMLLAEDPVNPRSFAVTSGAKPNPEPASAPEPSGLTDVRANQSVMRSISRAKA